MGLGLGAPRPGRVEITGPAPHVRGRVAVVPGSHGDLEVVIRAFEGADSVFWVVPPDRQAGSVEAAYVDFTRPAVLA
jgi:hypothetical protein